MTLAVDYCSIKHQINNIGYQPKLGIFIFAVDLKNSCRKKGSLYYMDWSHGVESLIGSMGGVLGWNLGEKF